MFSEEDGVWSFMLNQDGDEGDSDGILYALETQSLDEYDDYEGDEYDEYGYDGGIGAMSEPLVAQAKKTRPRMRALIVNAYPDFEDSYAYRSTRVDFYRRLEEDWKAKGVDTTLLEDVTVDAFAKLNGYNCVLIATHGARYEYTPHPRDNRTSGEGSVYFVCQRYRDESYVWELKDHQIVKSRNGYWILPNYFRAHYQSGSFWNVVVASESGNIFGDPGKTDEDLPYVFRVRGASAVVGFRNTLDSRYGRDFIKAFFDSMLEGETVKDSMSIAKKMVGKTQKDWWRRHFTIPYPSRYNCKPMYIGIEDYWLGKP